jgi:hypothetical protein
MTPKLKAEIRALLPDCGSPNCKYSPTGKGTEPHFCICFGSLERMGATPQEVAALSILRKLAKMFRCQST